MRIGGVGLNLAGSHQLTDMHRIAISSRVLVRSAVASSFRAPAAVRAMSSGMDSMFQMNILPIQASFCSIVPTSPPASSVVPAIECPEFNDIFAPIMAIKRTYQPSVLRRKRKFGFRVRKASIGGRNVLNNRWLKGRKRLSV
ncbi:Aste57867_8924 [Aphanomyces stellatus]|uniref:Large ribosomal subunit protein bL34m n=1 Tax=Aphanomyces stellatus TaxID=120398 RepID=A0A485KLQ5_9STRA|nr:hypothetical protein As57867_008889 [Aphanomyces stellatus]VFT85808.1 Aste57867_8924 [Aphanomyces stellatus]